MTDLPVTQLSRGNRRTIPSTCRTHGGPRGFCNLRLTKVGGDIVLDPHVVDCCVIVLDKEQATAVRDTLTQWLKREPPLEALEEKVVRSERE